MAIEAANVLIMCKFHDLAIASWLRYSYTSNFKVYFLVNMNMELLYFFKRMCINYQNFIFKMYELLEFRKFSCSEIFACNMFMLKIVVAVLKKR